MNQHGPNCLEGPVTRSRDWWTEIDPVNVTTQLPPRDQEETLMDYRSLDAHPEPAIRADLVERVQQEIAAGIYETPEKWEIALDQLLQRLEQE